MNILHVITSLHTGGAEHLMVDLLPQLKLLGNEVELLLFDGTRTPFFEEIEKLKIKVHHFRINGNVYSPTNIFKLIKFIRKYDIIHTHNTACQLFVPIAKCLAFGGAKLVTTEHSANNRRRGKWYWELIDKWMYARYGKVICIAEQTETNLRQHIGNRKNMITIFNGVDTTKFLKPIKDISKSKCYHSTMVASLSDAKDQDTLIRAIKELPENYKLQIVGDGPRRNILENMVDELSLSSRIKFLGIRTDIPEILDNSDIIVLSSHWEGLSLSSIEGMASGRPFIASDVDGLHEMVNGAGVLFPHENHEALSKAIRDLCEDSSEYEKVAKKCQERAKEFDITKMADSYNSVYTELFNEHS